ncbi:hypothetical protein BRADI_3g47082v3 [Brachypodium distachyon]|uniref:Uncharacterized protein n=1 Tax=Brachypodium distachyon TaxID=15368 RepID=A0A2K2D3R7_BRADI|nr:hypothetical protein BRADI_3g47082v3 [Brachypodium distachyon]
MAAHPPTNSISPRLPPLWGARMSYRSLQVAKASASVNQPTPEFCVIELEREAKRARLMVIRNLFPQQHHIGFSHEAVIPPPTPPKKVSATL